MKHISRIAILLAAIALQLAPSLHAQEPAFTAKVPFEFSVGATTFPAGEYVVTRAGGLLRIENRDDHKGAYVFANGTDPSPDGKGHLEFHRADGTYFLRKLTTASSTTSMQLVSSKVEQRAQLADAGAHAVSRGR
ncbi:MAG TPA: hypothetical protein VHZ28_12515 [Terracidiphilus sp.]|nr:hypothetical protein [Terracidiphilus sp.]